jgi:hypothetical protein
LNFLKNDRFLPPDGYFSCWSQQHEPFNHPAHDGDVRFRRKLSSDGRTAKKSSAFSRARPS